MRATYHLAIASLALLSSAVYAATTEAVGFVQFASDNSVSARRVSAEPGILLATELRDGGSNQVAALTIGSPDATRIRVIDRYALHRTPLEVVEYPDYYIELGDGTSLLDGRTVRVFDNLVIPGTGAEPPSLHYTRSFRIVPLNGVSVVRAMLGMIGHPIPGELLPSDAACHLDWSCNDDGSVTATASCSQNSQTLTITLDVEIESLQGVPELENTIVDNLTESDYLYIDAYGQTSLGGLRAWVHDNYDRYRADRWTDYPAAGAVNLAAHAIKFSRDASLSTATTTATNDTLVLRQNGIETLRSVASVGTSGAFRIIGMSPPTSGSVTIYTSAGANNPYAQTRASLTSGEWTTPQNQTTTLTTYGGEPAYAITMPASSGSMFIRAVADDGGATGAYLYTSVPFFARGGIALQDPNGGWWKLAVDTSGNLSTSAISDVPEGIPQ